MTPRIPTMEPKTFWKSQTYHKFVFQYLITFLKFPDDTSLNCFGNWRLKIMCKNTKFPMRIHEDFSPIVKSLCLVMISTLTHFNTLEKSGQIVMQQIQPRFFFKEYFEGPLQGNFLWNNLSEILEGSSIKLWSHITKP